MSASIKKIKAYIPLELLKISSLKTSQKKLTALNDYYYKNYTYFHQERSKILDQLKTALIEKITDFSFENWSRIVPYQYTNNPLSARGSLKNSIGGRFNIGNLNEYKFIPFPALYIAQDYETSFRERFQAPKDTNASGLTPEELALTNKNSLTHVVLEGHITQILDLTKPNTLNKFYKEISNIKIPSELKKEARKLDIPCMPHVKSLKELRESILNANWRDLPMQVDIPANSQILGQISELTGIEGILYPSSKQHKKKCIAIFPRNFNSTESYIKIQTTVPVECKNNCLNKDTYTKLY